LREEYFKEIISGKAIMVTTNGQPWCVPSILTPITRKAYEKANAVKTKKRGDKK